MTEITKKSIVDKAVLVNLKLGKWGNSKRIKDDRAVEMKSDEAGIRADESLIRISKTLLDSPELEAIGKLDTETRKYIYDHSVPALVLEGLHFVSNEIIEEVDAALADFASKRAVLVSLAGDTYEDRINATAVRLGPAFDRGDYASKEEFMSEFTMEWGFLSLGVPEKLKEKPELWERENDKAQAKMVAATDACELRMRENFADIVTHMVDRISGKRENGKPKIFRDSMLDNAQEFIRSFAFRNLTEDEALAALVSEFSGILSEVTAEDLRTNEDLRDNTLNGILEVQTKLQKLMEV